MKVLSLNYRGPMNPLKKSSIKHLVETARLDIIFFQETLGTSLVVKSALEVLLLGWTFEVVDAKGHSGGLATRWSSRNCICTNYLGVELGLGVEIFGGDLNFSLGEAEIWGRKVSTDLLTTFFIHILD